MLTVWNTGLSSDQSNRILGTDIRTIIADCGLSVVRILNNNTSLVLEQVDMQASSDRTPEEYPLAHRDLQGM